MKELLLEILPESYLTFKPNKLKEYAFNRKVSKPSKWTFERVSSKMFNNGKNKKLVIREITHVGNENGMGLFLLTDQSKKLSKMILLDKNLKYYIPIMDYINSKSQDLTQEQKKTILINCAVVAQHIDDIWVYGNEMTIRAIQSDKLLDELHIFFNCTRKAQFKKLESLENVDYIFSLLEKVGEEIIDICIENKDNIGSSMLYSVQEVFKKYQRKIKKLLNY